MKPRFFPTPSDFYDWLKANHSTQAELWVGYYKKITKKASITWPESVDMALCFGWIDGLRRSIDQDSYMIRFTPRRSGSHWSAINIAKVKKLRKSGLMTSAGLDAFARRKTENSERAAHEQAKVRLSPDFLSKLKSNRSAFLFFQTIPSGAQKQTIWWVMSAKKEETRIRRLNILIECASQNQLIPQLRWGQGKKD